jgi:hypothetical protein
MEDHLHPDQEGDLQGHPIVQVDHHLHRLKVLKAIISEEDQGEGEAEITLEPEAEVQVEEDQVKEENITEANKELHKNLAIPLQPEVHREEEAMIKEASVEVVSVVVAQNHQDLHLTQALPLEEAAQVITHNLAQEEDLEATLEGVEARTGDLADSMEEEEAVIPLPQAKALQDLHMGDNAKSFLISY